MGDEMGDDMAGLAGLEDDSIFIPGTVMICRGHRDILVCTLCMVSLHAHNVTRSGQDPGLYPSCTEPLVKRLSSASVQGCINVY